MLDKLAKQTAIYGVSTILGRFLSYMLTPFYTRIFGLESYGIITDIYALIPFALVVALSGWALYEGTKVPNVRKVMILTDKVQEPFTIALLPDVHIHRALSAKKLQGIIDRTNELKPDVIALAGDIIDDTPETISDLTPLLSGFKAKYGVFAVDGNHEVYLGSKQAQVFPVISFLISSRV